MSSVGPVIVDCDVGVDDAVALALCIASDVDIIGITCVHGNTSLNNVISNTEWLLSVMKRKEIPIFRGAEKSLVGETSFDEHFHGEGGLGGLAKPASAPTCEEICQPEHAVMALLRLTQEQPGKITLLAIGPLTNVALAIRMDPGFTKRLKALLIMGGDSVGKGSSRTPMAEFNFYSDPEAAHVVLKETECPVTVVPFETCYGTPLPLEYYTAMKSSSSPVCRFLSKITSHSASLQSKKGIDGFVMCDALAAAVMINGGLVEETRVGPAHVERGGTYARGKLVELTSTWRKKSEGNDVMLVTKANKEEFHKLMLRVLKL